MVNGTAEPGPSLQTAQILGEGTPELSRRELGRWPSRQLTSMRTALLLLLLLALGAVPGSLIPQRGVDPSAVARFRLSHPSLSPWLDRFQVFSVGTVALLLDRVGHETGVMSSSSASAFAGFRFPREVISVAVRWYLRYGLSYRDVEELLAERGVTVDHVTI